MRSGAFIGLLLLTLILSCDTEKVMNATWPYGVKYEIFVLAFADGNGDGKGDLKGLTEKLDYVEELGVNGIWLMPIMPSPSYHKYDVTDYKDIHPDYGTLQDFKLFVEEAHRKNIRVVIDLVLNHTSKEHPWFKSASHGKDSPYRDYYVWADKDSIQDQIAKKVITLDSDNITQWHAVDEDLKAEHYYGFFSGRMPDLNFDNEKVRSEAVDIARFWLEDMNVDGFRFDAAKHIYPDDRAKDSHEFWIWYRAALEKIKPDVYLIGEVYSLDKNEVAPYTKGLPSLFNFEMGRAIITVLNKGKDTIGLIDQYQKQNDFFKEGSPGFLDSPILTNHDQNRIMSELGNDISKAKVAASILLTLPGAPYLYYGEELGMTGKKPDEFIREPFPWGDGKYTTAWMNPTYNTDSTTAVLSHQQENVSSLFNHYKRLIAYRNSSDALTKGDVQRIDRLPSEIIGLTRSFENDNVSVFHNVSDVEITLSLSLYKEFTKIDFSTTESATFDNMNLTLPAYASVVLRK
jgi:alpha-amylase